LGKLEEAREEFRSEVLAVELLEMVGAKARGVLARGMVFELAVPRSVFGAVCGEAVERAVDLGLLEVMPRGELRVSRVLGLVCPEDETLMVAAARELYGVWENEESEERRLEMHRLAMLAKNGEIAATIANRLSEGWRNSRYRETVALCRKTMEISSAPGFLTELAIAEKELGNPETALELHQKVLENCTSDNESLKATTLHCIARIYSSQGKVSEAIELYEQSLEIKKAIGNQQGIAATLNQMAILYKNQGRIEEAFDYHRKSLEIAEQGGYKSAQASALHGLANIYRNQGKMSEAIDLYYDSLEIKKAIGDQQGIAGTLHALANVYSDQGKVSDAIDLYYQSLELEKAIGNQQGIAITLASIGRLIAVHQGDFDTAFDYLQQSGAILRHIGSPMVNQVVGIIQDLQEIRGVN
jgi:tetratricopeptide (TPR) repeat protein